MSNTVKAFAALVLSLVIVEASAGIAEVRALYQQINASLQTKPTRQVLLFAFGEPGKYQWRSVGEKGGQEEFKKSDYRAQAYFQGDRLVKAVLETKSQSGDWKFTEEYYFYDSGKTAFYFRSLITFQGYDFDHDKELPAGPYAVEDRRYFDETGKPIRHLEKAFVQATKQEVPVKYIRANLPIEVYPDVRSLPFDRAGRDSRSR
jgi:hypothetical protein